MNKKGRKMVKGRNIFYKIAVYIYAISFCRSYGQCIGICTKKFSKEEIDKAVADSYDMFDEE